MNKLLHERYEKKAVLGTGGFSTIYLALDRKTGDDVCVKKFTAEHMSGVSPELKSHGYTIALRQEDVQKNLTDSRPTESSQTLSGKADPGDPAGNSIPHTPRSVSLSDADKLVRGLAQIRREAQTLKVLSDIPGVPALIETFRENHTCYLVKEYLEGMTLAEYEDRFRGSMPFSLAFFIMRGTLEILQKVHERGYLHCDVSPVNIFLCRDGSVHLIDWGNTVDRKGSMDDGTVRQAVNARYAAPEQHISGAALDPRTDLYCLSASVYEAVCGEPPIPAIRRLRGEELIPPQIYSSELPAFAALLLEDGLALDLCERYSSAAKMTDAIDEEILYSVTPVAGGGASVSARLLHEKRSPMGFLTSRRLRRPTVFLE